MSERFVYLIVGIINGIWIGFIIGMVAEWLMVRGILLRLIAELAIVW